MKKLIAITGGIGSGKSAVLRMVKALGWYVISADDVNRELLLDDDYLSQLRYHFGEAFFDGQFHKEILAKIIFTDSEKRLLLNSIAHVRIRALIENKIAKSKSNLVFVEVPLLIESGMMGMFDDILVVTADKEIKIKRVMHRDDMTREEVLERMASQLDDHELISIATYVINNDGSLDDLEKKVVDIVRQIGQK